ncbi:hypothetical protein T492DRAFT_1141354 [Pavlovales sp. CCMP2436]|nr:hypothetical protein T492DRAFT_1141354 [Pavlovales sp. CCMP2436]
MLGLKLLSGVGLVLLSLSLSAAVVQERPVDIGTAGNFVAIAAKPASYVTATSSSVTGSVLAGAAVTFVGTAYTRDRDQSFPQGGGVEGATAIADFRMGFFNVSTRAVSAPAYNIGVSLGGVTLTQGLYHSAAALGITPAGAPGNVIFRGNEKSVFIIRVTAHLVLAAGVEILLEWDGTGTGPPVVTNVIWHVTSYVTLGAGAILRGTILCGDYVIFGAAAKIYGRALAENYISIPGGLIDEVVASVTTGGAGGAGGGSPTGNDPVTGPSAATISTGLSQTALGAIIGSILGLFLLIGAGTFILYRRRTDAAFRKTIAKAVSANTSGISAVAPPALRPARASGLHDSPPVGMCGRRTFDVYPVPLDQLVRKRPPPLIQSGSRPRRSPHMVNLRSIVICCA